MKVDRRISALLCSTMVAFSSTEAKAWFIDHTENMTVSGYLDPKSPAYDVNERYYHKSFQIEGPTLKQDLINMITCSETFPPQPQPPQFFSSFFRNSHAAMYNYSLGANPGISGSVNNAAIPIHICGLTSDPMRNTTFLDTMDYVNTERLSGFLKNTLSAELVTSSSFKGRVNDIPVDRLTKAISTEHLQQFFLLISCGVLAMFGLSRKNQ